ncbi:MAG: HAMP domain-containing protein [Chloroflexi bacterium]|jgi:HAMP domain-containing protein|nr:HAMP domain-containing protein [Chloroflexota bacterium]
MAKNRSFFKSLRGKLSLQMLLISLIPIIIIGLLVNLSMSDAENQASDSVDEARVALESDTIGAHLAKQAKQMSNTMETWMSARSAQARAYAVSPVVTTVAADASNEVYVGAANTFLMDQLSINPYFAVVTVTDATGMAVAGAFSAPQSDRTIIPMAGISPQLMAPPPDGPGGMLSYVPSWQALMASEYDTYINETPYFVEAAGMYFVDVTTKVKDASGNVVGAVIASTIQWPTTMGQAYAGMYPDSEVLVFNREGGIQCDTRSWGLTATGVQPVEVDANGNPVQRWFDNDAGTLTSPDSIVWTESEKTVRDILLNAENEIINSGFFTTSDGQYIVGYARDANSSLYFGEQTIGYAGTGQLFMIEQPTEMAFASLDSLETLEDDLADSTSSMTVTVIVILLIAAIIVLGIALWISGSITKPIAQLNDAAEKVSMGDMDVAVTVKSDDEIGDLAESFGRMVAAVRFLSEDDEEN